MSESAVTSFQTYTLAVLLFVFYVILPTPAFADYTIELGGGNDSLLEFGGDANTGGDSDMVAALAVTLDAGTVEELEMSVKKVATPTDNIVVEFFASDGTKPTGSALATSEEQVGSELSTSCTPTMFYFSTPVEVTATTDYWLVLRRTGTLSNTNKYHMCGTNAGAASNMIAYHRTDTGVWATHSELDEFLAGGNVFVLTEGGGGGASSTPPVVLFTTPSNKMHLETFTSFYYAITVAIGLYFALILFRLFGRRHAR